MRTSKRKFEGLLTIDHRESPGITLEQAAGRGPAVGKGQFLEVPILQCVHCQRGVVLNPLRTRPQHYCQKCDDYQCDLCATLPCVPFQKIIDEVLSQGAQAIFHERFR